jgi:hypothetical protein
MATYLNDDPETMCPDCLGQGYLNLYDQAGEPERDQCGRCDGSGTAPAATVDEREMVRETMRDIADADQFNAVQGFLEGCYGC